MAAAGAEEARQGLDYHIMRQIEFYVAQAFSWPKDVRYQTTCDMELASAALAKYTTRPFGTTPAADPVASTEAATWKKRALRYATTPGVGARNAGNPMVNF